MRGNGNDGAFPLGAGAYREAGLTKREYLAGLAMAGIASKGDTGGFDYSEGSAKRVATHALYLADALLSALSEGAP